ncbi:putative Flp pilus-assembly TadE/G-like protein [Arthrobacter sp. SLBN-112]|uniref:TadE/TadG family type IV pilus assembly protein n=1 Tax=Arthrobacter sp. SLBN-112 TaxID=2768452 RepID=UPI001154E7E7|nr:TadE/TadG family type IV pilus assembly protein [Arthrobacter sp. SLBN-112]TQJ41750.1 putative Flp pilus-assembly TadE/G-like protein [Arthrobacter sp. SLBN-112]
MRRLKTKHNERGVIAPVAALSMVALLGLTAFAVDVSMMYSEHAQLQNGADAAALGIAQGCLISPASAACSSPVTEASALANVNALDSHSNVISATVSSGLVDVTTQAQDTSGNNHFSLVFARALGIQTSDIRATAQAKYGGFSAGNVIPLGFSKCESDPGFTKDLQFFPSHGDALSSDPAYECTTTSSSGLEIPGGFGWLDHPSGTCSAYVNIADPWVGTNAGSDYDADCAATMNKWGATLSDPSKTVEILIPIFDDARGTGSNAEFHIEAFAQISLRGWNLAGGSTLPEDFMTTEAKNLSKDLKLKNSDNGIFGRFIKKVSLAEAMTLGGPTTYGLTGAQLTK